MHTTINHSKKTLFANMKSKNLIFSVFFCLTFPVLGISQKANHSFTHWSGIEIGFPTLNSGNWKSLDENHDLTTQDRNSISFGFNLLEKKWGNSNSGTGFFTGLSFSIKSYDWEKNIELKNNGDLAVNQLQIIENTEENFKLNQLNVISLSVPLILELNFSKNQKSHFHLASGFLANWNLSEDQYFQYNNEKGRFQNYRKQNVGVNRFSLDHTFRLGVGKYTFFVTQGITPFFQEKVMKNIYSASFGVSLIPFDVKSEDQKKKYNIKDRWKI